MKPKSFKKGDRIYVMASEVMNEEQLSFEPYFTGLCKPKPEDYPSNALESKKTYGETFAHEISYFTPY